jgi:hypothetical protein
LNTANGDKCSETTGTFPPTYLAANSIKHLPKITASETFFRNFWEM